MERERSSTDHFAYLDSVRALAAIWVLLGHAWLEVWPFYYGKTPSGGIGAATSWLLYAHFAVDVFIVLSGFCLMLPVVRRGGVLMGGTRLFFFKRCRRILPPFYAALLVCAILIATIVGTKTGTLWDYSVPVTARGFVTNLLMFQDVFHKGEYNHVFWSIAVEWKIYFLFPLIVAAFRRWGGARVSVMVSAASIVIAFLIRHSVWDGLTVQYIGLFVLGCFAADVALGDRFGRATAAWQVRAYIASVVALAAIIVVCRTMGFSWASYHFYVLDFAVAAVVVPLLADCAARPDFFARRILSWRPLAFVGTFSYSLYLIHGPLLQAVWQYWVNPWHLPAGNAFLLMCATTPVIFAASYGFFVVFERPFMSRHHARAVAAVAPTTRTEQQAVLPD